MIREYAAALAAYTDGQWLRYAYAREPLAGKLTERQRLEFYQGAVGCAAEQAELWRERWGGAGVLELAAKAGVAVKFDTAVYDGVPAAFATYSPADGVAICADIAAATDRLIAEEGLDALAGGVKTQDLLLAHELFHHIENHTPDIYVLRKHVLLFKIGRWENRSRLTCLAEVAAMAFAKALTNLPCSPYIFDLLMLYAKNPQRAQKQFNGIQAICAAE